MHIKKKIAFAAAAAAAAAVTAGCSEDSMNLGNKWVDPGTDVIIIDTCTVEISSVKMDSVATSGGNVVFAGIRKSDYWGTTGLSTYMTFKHTESSDWWTAETKSVCDITPYMDFGIQYHCSLGSGRSITAGVDYSFYKYSSLDTGSDIIKYKDRNRLTAGITYVPSRYDVRRYWKRIKFQMGAYVDDSYLTASGSRGLKFDRYTFPVSNRNTISESSLGLTFGGTFGESWFVRKRLE